MRHIIFNCLLLSALSNVLSVQEASAQILFTVDASKNVGENTGFWKACGYDFLFKIVNEPEGQTFLDRAQKNNSVIYYRTHFTFSDRSSGDKKAGGSICGKVVRRDSKGVEYYDFSIINKTFKEYAKRGMKPIVEFDFYPEGWAKKDEIKNDEAFVAPEGAPASWEKWQDLLDKFMQNLIKEFGAQELRTWYFEVWNEPDSWKPESLPDFFKLYDVFSHAVKSYNNDFRVGGPGAYTPTFLKEFFDHITHGTNYVTGQIGSPIDFVSYHIYGMSGSWLNQEPEIVPLVQTFSTDLLWLQRLMNKYPLLKKAEFHLNEWGMCSHGDSKFVDKYPQLEFRNSEANALFMVKLINCLYALDDNYKFRTDLMLFWGAWFNAAKGPIFMGSRDLMTSGCVPKPVLTGYEMLARLGDKRIKVTGPKTGGQFGLLAAKSTNQCQLLVYNYNELEEDFTRKTQVKLVVDNLPFTGKQVSISEYWLSPSQHNTYREWERMGKPPSSPEVIEKLKKSGELNPDKQFYKKLTNNEITIDLEMLPHTMCLLILE